MADTISTERRHYVMSRVRSQNTTPELRLRHGLWRRGFRYIVNDKRLPGKPDIVLPKYKSVIFVHGCFWHGHKGCKLYRIPKTNTEFWRAKVTRNQERDQEVWRQLESKGWSVIIVWECQLKKNILKDTVESVAAEIRRNGEAYLCDKEERRASREEYLQSLKVRRSREAMLLSEIKNRGEA